jgi:Tfp pilus assembly protein PilX
MRAPFELRWPMSKPRQRGAALIVSLLLLGMLITAAIGAMHAVALELVMAGNEHYRQRALAAANAATALLADAMWAAPAGVAPVDLARQPMTGMSGDFLSAEVRELGSDPAVAAASGGMLAGTRYRITAHGSSLRDAVCDVELGVVMIRDAAGNPVELRHRYWKQLPD